MNPKEWPSKIMEKLTEYRRVLKVTKKPTNEEFKTIVKISGLGMLAIGFIGFLVVLIRELLL